eukprot:GHVO01025691.1.p1 GENE.GHVO01025691.1~~GHVO01025691.1.p1  ORF type:complete len:101 (+),score=8.27 GHVO01025691.1:1059-1361(+)
MSQFQSTAFYVDDLLTKQCVTSTGRPTKGKGIPALLGPFQNILRKYKLESGDSITNKAVVEMARSVIEKIESHVDPYALIDAANFNGTILKQGQSWTIRT